MTKKYDLNKFSILFIPKYFVYIHMKYSYGELMTSISKGILKIDKIFIIMLVTINLIPLR